MKKQLMTLLAFAVALCSFAQDDLYYPDSLAPEKPSEEWDYAREVTQNLCSNAMAGRGYGKAGNKLAADYIVNEFQSMGSRRSEDSTDSLSPSRPTPSLVP